jgi:chromosome segregation ATPase
MSEHESNERIERTLARVQIELRIQEERIAQQEVRITQLEKRADRHYQRINEIQAKHDQCAHRMNLIMRYIGLTDEDLQQLERGSLKARYLFNTVGRREN